MKNSLLRRNIGLLVGVVLAGQLLAGLMVIALVLRPQTIRVADVSARMLNAVSAAMDGRNPAAQGRIAQRINDDASIQIRAAENPPGAGGLAFPNFIERVFMHRLATRLSAQDELQWRTDDAGHLWMLVRLGGRFWWVNMTPPRVAGPLIGLIMALLIAFIVAVAGGLLLQRRLDRPLRSLARGVASYQPGSTPPRITVDGPGEITAVAHAFNDMADRINAHEQERALMLAGVSHDLRTPLARLRLSIEMMPHDDEALRESAHRQIEQIDRMLGQFLDYAREGRDEERQIVNLGKLLLQAAEDAGMAGELTIDVDGGLTASVRPFAMRRVIQNLLENASRYGAPPIVLRAWPDDREGLIVEVIDHGEGFDPQMADHLVRPFAKADRSRTGEGTGLGLAIAQRHVTEEGGTLSFERSSAGFVARIVLPAPG